MIQEYFDVFWFIIAFGIGMFLAYVSTPHPEIIYKYPTLYKYPMDKYVKVNQ